ncbi:MAG: aspartate kinase [Candidatus Wallbacteria bacterium]|nr:aspartate kinase [Candidatus Wallbacteria bacterium]
MSGIVIYKFGGSSLSDPDRVMRVAEKIKKIKDSGEKILVVVSAQGNTTDELIKTARSYYPVPAPRELDALLSCGENISAAILSAVLGGISVKSVSLSAFQLGLLTDSNFGNAHIKTIENTESVRQLLNEGVTPVITGFQGIDRNRNITTLGRGGSDTTAVAIAHALDARECVLCTDVLGVYTADPRIVPKARLLREISYEEMYELSAAGAKVINFRALDLAKNHGIRIYRRSTFEEGEGTLISKGSEMEDNRIKGITYSKQEAKISVLGLDQKSNSSLKILSEIEKSGINIEFLMDNITYDGLENLVFLVKRDKIVSAVKVLETLADLYEKIIWDVEVGTVSIVGSGLREKSGVIFRIMSLLSERKIPIYMVSTSEIKVTIVVNAADVEKVVLLLHEGFGLENF